jgi:hypothetical protein
MKNLDDGVRHAPACARAPEIRIYVRARILYAQSNGKFVSDSLVQGPQGVVIYLMKPDGSGRKQILIAKGEFLNVQPEFFPEGSGFESRVIYQTEKNPSFNF